jgi:hypothetical protein
MHGEFTGKEREERHEKERLARERRKGMGRNDRLENGAKASEGTIGNGTEERHGQDNRQGNAEK